jgi:hypothetical protein
MLLADFKHHLTAPGACLNFEREHGGKRRKYSLDSDFNRSGTVYDITGPWAVLRRSGSFKKHPVGADALHGDRGNGLGFMADRWLFSGLF